MTEQLKTIPYKEDVFEPTTYLGVGFNNELTSKVYLDPKQTRVIRQGTILTPEERFAATKDGLEADENVRLEMITFPEKMKMIERVIAILNQTDDVLTYKRAMNKMTRLLKGRDAELLYQEEKERPDHLVIDYIAN